MRRAIRSIGDLIDDPSEVSRIMEALAHVR